MTLDYSYQQLFTDHAVDVVATGGRQLYCSPTGTGKTRMELNLRDKVPNSWIITPSEEIIAGFLDVLQLPYSPSTIIKTAWEHQITTPVTLRNRLLEGKVINISCLIVDEAHHQVATSYQDILLLTGEIPVIGLTATPYRGTPKGTKALLDWWGEPIWVLTLQQAVEKGVCSLPSFKIVPLIDDEYIEVRNGEFLIASIESEMSDRLSDAVDYCRKFFNGETYDKATMVALPSTELIRQFANACGNILPYVVVTAATSPLERQEAFQKVLAKTHMLLQIKVVSEGVDLRIERLIDLFPMISPTMWFQMLGRTTRPGLEPEYICMNRNLLRHAYLLEGLCPTSVYKEGQAAFGGVVGKRECLRSVGLEKIGRYTPEPITFADGLTGLVYHMTNFNGKTTDEFCCLIHPLHDPIWGQKESKWKDNGERDYGRWVGCETPIELAGFKSKPVSTLTDKQTNFWKRESLKRGLDPDVSKVNRRNFVALPLLCNLRKKVIV